MANIVQHSGREDGWGLFNNNLDNVLDNFFNPHSETPGKRNENLVPAVDLHEAENGLTLLQPDCAHDFPTPMRDKAYQLFDQALKRR